jgi:hypothetical protein
MAPSTFDPQSFDLAIILTAAGAVVASALIAAFIQVLKRLGNLGDILEAGRETTLAIVLSAVLVAYAFVATAVPVSMTSLFLAFLAFLNIAGLAGKVYDVAPDGVKSALSGNPA